MTESQTQKSGSSATPRTYRGTPIRTVRIDDDAWQQVTELAEQQDVTAGDIIRAALDAYLPTQQ